MQGLSRLGLAVIVTLLASACTSSASSDVLLSAGGAEESTYVLKVEREPLALELSRLGTPEDDDERVEGYGTDPSLDDAAEFYVVDNAKEMTLVAGPVTGEAARVVVRSGVSSSEASLVDVGETRLFVARLVGHVPYDSIVAFDDDGEPLDVTAEQ